MMLIDSVLEHLDLEQIETNLFRGISEALGSSRVFGGQVIGQALIAALRTIEGRPCHSLHGYFLRPGDPSIPIIYEVDRIRDGKSFTTRRVIAIQKGEAIFNMSASFQVFEDGLSHQIEMPDVPLFMALQVLLAAWWLNTLVRRTALTAKSDGPWQVAAWKNW